MFAYHTPLRARRRVLLALVPLLTIPLLFGPIEDASAGTPRTPIWVGSPVDGNWPGSDDCSGAKYPSASCSLPFAHHTYYWGNAYRGDWGYDQRGVSAGEDVFLYAAPQDSRLGSSIRAKVERVVNSCSGSVYGGKTVVIGLYNSSTRSGTVAYAHVAPTSAMTAGAYISRWGTKIGDANSYRKSSCWEGVHVHIELLSDTNYACYNKGWRPGQTMYKTNFIGYVGGSFATAPRRSCP